MTESASATITAQQIDPTHWQYSITLTDTGSTTIGTFWFGWIPGEDFLATAPSNIQTPSGWRDLVTHEFPADGFGIRWTAASPAEYLAAGGALGGFSFTSTDAPSAIFGASTVDPAFPATTSFVYSGTPFSDAGVLITATTACFLPGTHILTESGEVPVERLRVGDRVITAGGRSRRICWIGFGRALATRGRRSDVTPVIVRKGALADNVPHRDLHITKGHALFVDGVLIPAEFLVNHRSILWDDRAQEVTVYHLELDAHDVLLANGAPAESFRDDGNRWMFQNANTGWGLPPKPPCAPVLTGGPVVDTAWRRLLDRCGPRARLPLTEQPDLHLRADGVRVDGAASATGYYVFALAGVPAVLRLESRAVVPQEIGLARDARSLGVAVRRILVRQGSGSVAMEAGDPALADGFHAFEVANGFRWTDGDARLPVSLFTGFVGAVEVVVQVAATGVYVEDTADARVA